MGAITYERSRTAGDSAHAYSTFATKRWDGARTYGCPLPCRRPSDVNKKHRGRRQPTLPVPTARPSDNPPITPPPLPIRTPPLAGDSPFSPQAVALAILCHMHAQPRVRRTSTSRPAGERVAVQNEFDTPCDAPIAGVRPQHHRELLAISIQDSSTDNRHPNTAAALRPACTGSLTHGSVRTSEFLRTCHPGPARTMATIEPCRSSTPIDLPMTHPDRDRLQDSTCTMPHQASLRENGGTRTGARALVSHARNRRA
ncbi:hypothetical protein BD414DRAFT_40772 [Trametes punicea]|nr:hypothetical protein BD414DRAFT_40772 [Trametes punicea]